MNSSCRPAPTENIKINLGESDLVRRSASTVPQPQQRLTEVAKLIDVSKCIGCKACQVACLEWNDRTERIGFNYGVYDDPVDLTPESFTVMRFTEWVNPETEVWNGLSAKTAACIAKTRAA